MSPNDRERVEQYCRAHVAIDLEDEDVEQSGITDWSVDAFQLASRLDGDDGE